MNLISVPSYKRNVSSTEYIQKLAELNDYLKTIVFRAPKKYRGAYGYALIDNGLNAYLCASDADRISLRKNAPKENYLKRIALLNEVLRYTGHVEYISQLFFMARQDIDHEEISRINRQAEKIGTYRVQIDNLVKANMKFVRQKMRDTFK